MFSKITIFLIDLAGVLRLTNQRLVLYNNEQIYDVQPSN